MYCAPADIYGHGVPRGSVPFPARLLASVSAGANAFELDGHGFALNDTLGFRAEAGGSLPAPLAESVTYYARPLDDSWFEVAAASGGAAIDVTTAGSNVLVIAKLSFDDVITWAGGLIDDMIPTAVLPLVAPYPPIVVATCAELAGWKMAALTGSATESLGKILDGAQRRLDRWSKGAPIRGTNAPASAAKAISASATGRDTRGWSRYGSIG